MTNGERLKRIRERQGLTQRELARISGVPSPTISFVESGQRSVMVETAIKLCEALGVYVEDVFKAGE